MSATALFCLNWVPRESLETSILQQDIVPGPPIGEVLSLFEQTHADQHLFWVYRDFLRFGRGTSCAIVLLSV